MAVYDRWHKAGAPGDKPCGCGTAKRPLYPSAVHKKGDRWQVRWRAGGKQPRKNFAKKEGKNPAIHADAFDAKNTRDLHTGDYVDPDLAELTFQQYAEKTWRANRTHGQTTAGKVERSFRLHVYQGDGRPGRTPRGGPALGHHKLRSLAAQPSLSQGWIAGLKLDDGTAAGLVANVSSVFNAAVDDGIIRRNPLLAKSVSKPVPHKNDAIPLTMAEIDALTWGLRHTARCRADCSGCEPNRFDILPMLGMNTGMRQGELFGLAVPDIDFLHREITVRRQVKLVDGEQIYADIKNDKVHTVPVPQALCNLISRYMQLFPPVKVTLPLEEDGEMSGSTATHPLLMTRNGQLAMHREGVNGRWKSGLKRAGIPVERRNMMHVLRHTAASIWLSKGMGTRAVAEFLGDTEATVISTYSHMMPDDRDKARKAMEDFIGAGTGDDPAASAVSHVP